MSDRLINRIIRSRRRTLSLQVTAEAELIIRAPHRVSLETIHDAVRQKLPWILKRQQWAKQNWRPPEHKKFAEGEDFHYLGQPYKLGILKDCAEPLTFDGSRFLLAESCATEARAHFIAWYRRRALELIGWRVLHYADRIAARYGRIRISDARTRWGSCSPSGTLSFSWRLILAPVRVVDYVVVHELAHLEQRNHSHRFWDKVRDVYPDYRQDRRWLRVNDRSLRFD